MYTILSGFGIFLQTNVICIYDFFETWTMSYKLINNEIPFYTLLFCSSVENEREDQPAVFPKHQIVSAGESADFVCVSEDFASFNFNGGQLLFNTHFVAKPEIQQYWIKIPSVEMANSGTYECYDVDNPNYVLGQGVLSVTSKYTKK